MNLEAVAIKGYSAFPKTPALLEIALCHIQDTSYPSAERQSVHSAAPANWIMPEKRREFWQNKPWLLHHDNASVHYALNIPGLLAERNQTGTTIIFTWCFSVWLFLFFNLKGIIKGVRFEVVEAVTTELRGIQEESFQRGIDALQESMGKCIRLEVGVIWKGNPVVCCLELK